MDRKESIVVEDEDELREIDFKRPRNLRLDFRRLLAREKDEITDPRPIRNAIILRFGRANCWECPDKACQRQWLCQRPSYKCHLAHYADLYDWDFGNPNCPRQAMYDELKRRWQAGEYQPGTYAAHLAEVVRAFQPELGKKRRFWTRVKDGEK